MCRILIVYSVFFSQLWRHLCTYSLGSERNQCCNSPTSYYHLRSAQSSCWWSKVKLIPGATFHHNQLNWYEKNSIWTPSNKPEQHVWEREEWSMFDCVMAHAQHKRFSHSGQSQGGVLRECICFGVSEIRPR